MNYTLELNYTLEWCLDGYVNSDKRGQKRARTDG